MSRILVVCTANVCRSPLAERLLRRRLGSTPVEVSSAGTRGLTGAPMCALSATELPADDPFPHEHVARELDGDLVAAADLVITMEREQRSVAVRAAPGSQAKVFTLREALLLGEALEDRGEPRPADLAGLARQLHSVRGTVMPPTPPPPPRRWWRKPEEPADPLTIVDGHGLDDAAHHAAAAQVHELTDRLATLLAARLP